MKMRYRKFLRGRIWWVQDSRPQPNGKAGKQKNLRTRDEAEAERLLASLNEPYRFAAYNLQMARTQLQMASPEITSRTWQEVMVAVVKLKFGVTKDRYERAVKSKTFDGIRGAVLIETTAESLLDLMDKGTVCTNV